MTRPTPSEDPLYATLASRAETNAARDLVVALRTLVEAHEDTTGSRVYKRQGRMLQRLEDAIGAFVADLLLALRDEEAEGWVYRSMKEQTYTGEAVSYANFRDIVKAMTGAQLVVRVKGAPKWVKSFDEDGPPMDIGGSASRFRATPQLVFLAESKGITPENVDDHFLQDLPKHPLVLKSASTKDSIGRKVEGHRMSFKHDPVSERLEADVRRLNEFLDGFTLRGGRHRGYIRLFNLGDQEGFRWNKGGRLYSQGNPSYQRLKEEQRVAMTIDGEPVVEVDIKASYLTILHGVLRMPFDPSQDPYEVEGLKELTIGDRI